MPPYHGVLASSRSMGQPLRAQHRLAPILLTTIILCAIQVRAGYAAAPGTTASEEVSLPEAIRRSLAHNPALRALAWELPKAAGRLRQAGARPNPDLSLDVDNFSGSKTGSSRAEATASLGYRLEVGGKRSARIGLARADQATIAVDLESRRIEIATETAVRFVRLQSQESALQLTEAEVLGAEAAHTTTSERVRSGAAHSVEERRAQVELANVRLERIQLESQTALLQKRLAEMWGEPAAELIAVVGESEPLSEPPTLDSLLARSEAAPSVSRWRGEGEVLRRELALRQAEAIPDLGIMAGIRSLREPSERVLVGGVSVPIPLFDRNAGAIAAARAGVSQVEDEWANARLQARSRVIAAHAAVVRSRRRLDALRLEVLPGADRALEDLRIGFERGRFNYLDLLEARRTRSRARRDELETLLEYRLAMIELNGLTATTVNQFTDAIGAKR